MLSIRPSRALIALVTGLLLYCAPTPARAQGTIPALPEVPSQIAATHPELVQRRAELAHERASLHKRSDDHNARCTSVVAGSDDDQRCAAELDGLKRDVTAHIVSSNEFIAALGAAEQMAQTCAPSAVASARLQLQKLTSLDDGLQRQLRLMDVVLKEQSANAGEMSKLLTVTREDAITDVFGALGNYGPKRLREAMQSAELLMNANSTSRAQDILAAEPKDREAAMRRNEKASENLHELAAFFKVWGVHIASSKTRTNLDDLTGFAAEVVKDSPDLNAKGQSSWQEVLQIANVGGAYIGWAIPPIGAVRKAADTTINLSLDSLAWLRLRSDTSLATQALQGADAAHEFLVNSIQENNTRRATITRQLASCSR